MKLTVFGATGRIGGHVVRQALDLGHEVTAVVRDPARLAVGAHESLTVAVVPVLTDAHALEPAVDGADAVLSGIGPTSRRDAGVTTVATRAVLGAMAATGVRRIVVVSAMPVGPAPDGESLLGRWIAYPLISRVLRPVYDDLATVEADLRASGTDWTVVRPPRLTDAPLSGNYRTVIGANVPNGHLAGRADVADAMLAALTNQDTIARPVGVAR